MYLIIKLLVQHMCCPQGLQEIGKINVHGGNADLGAETNSHRGTLRQHAPVPCTVAMSRRAFLGFP